MRHSIPTLAVLCLCFCAPHAYADDYCGDNMQQVRFVRDDLVTLKKHMDAIVAAIGQPPAPYAREVGNWTLPDSTCQGKAGYVPISVAYSTRFSIADTQQALQAQYQKDMLAAQAKGDYEALAQIAQKYQAQAMQQAAVAQMAQPIDMHIEANRDDSATIDPDSVVRDGPGFIAIRTSGGSAGAETVTIYFDRVALKNAHELASFNLMGGLVPKKLGLIHMRVELSGPKTTVEGLVKNLDVQKVLGELSEQRVVQKGANVGC